MNAFLKFYVKLLIMVFKCFPAMIVTNVATISVFLVILSETHEHYRKSTANC